MQPATSRDGTLDFGEVNRPLGDASWEIWERIYWKAGKYYKFQRLESHGVLFRTRHSDKAHIYPIHADLGWGRLFNQGLRIVEVPGDHFSLLKDPHALTLADRLKECMNGLFTPGRPGNASRK